MLRNGSDNAYIFIYRSIKRDYLPNGKAFEKMRVFFPFLFDIVTFFSFSFSTLYRKTTIFFFFFFSLRRWPFSNSFRSVFMTRTVMCVISINALAIIIRSVSLIAGIQFLVKHIRDLIDISY